MQSGDWRWPPPPVWFPAGDLGERQAVEDAIAKSLSKDGVDAEPAEIALPPTRTCSGDRAMETLKKDGLI